MFSFFSAIINLILILKIPVRRYGTFERVSEEWRFDSWVRETLLISKRRSGQQHSICFSLLCSLLLSTWCLIIRSPLVHFFRYFKNEIIKNTFCIQTVLAKVARHRIVVTTCSSSGGLYKLGLAEGHFTHCENFLLELYYFKLLF